MPTTDAVQEAAAALSAEIEVSIAGKVAALELLVGLLRDQAAGVPLEVARLAAWRRLLERRAAAEKQLADVMAAQAKASWSARLRNESSN